MQRTLEQRTCDKCGKVSVVEPAGYSGGPAHPGWIHITIQRKTITGLSENLDFCGISCAIAALVERQQKA